MDDLINLYDKAFALLAGDFANSYCSVKPIIILKLYTKATDLGPVAFLFISIFSIMKWFARLKKCISLVGILYKTEQNRLCSIHYLIEHWIY